MDLESARHSLEAGSTADRSRALSWIRDCAADSDAVGTLGALVEACLGHPEPLIRAEAAEALARPEFAAWRTSLWRILSNDPEPMVRAAAAESLGDANDPSWLGILRQAIQDSDSVVRGYAAASIGLLGSFEDTASLVACLDRETSSSRFDFMVAICRLDDRPESVARLNGGLAEMSSDDAYRALNVVEDVLVRRTPSCVRNARDDLLRTLSNLASRLDSIHRKHIARLRTLMENLPT